MRKSEPRPFPWRACLPIIVIGMVLYFGHDVVEGAFQVAEKYQLLFNPNTQ